MGREKSQNQNFQFNVKLTNVERSADVKLNWKLCFPPKKTFSVMQFELQTSGECWKVICEWKFAFVWGTRLAGCLIWCDRVIQWYHEPMKLDHEDPQLRFAQNCIIISAHWIIQFTGIFRDFHAKPSVQAAFDFVWSLLQLPYAFMNTKLVSSIDSFVSAKLVVRGTS